MSLNVDEWVERVWSGIRVQNPALPITLKDDIYQLQFDALQGLGEAVSNSPVRALLSRDFQVASVSGVCDLSTVTLVGGAALSTANIYSLVIDSIPRGKVLHPDSTRPCQYERSTIAVDKTRRDSLGWIFYTIAQNSLYMKTDTGVAPSDQNVVLKSSFNPTFDFFSGTSASLNSLEAQLVGVGERLMAPRVAQAAA